ncbi:MAG: hypothetical protein ACREM2_04900 [Vulcanimicrobiaceae bacterium]
MNRRLRPQIALGSQKAHGSGHAESSRAMRAFWAFRGLAIGAAGVAFFCASNLGARGGAAAFDPDPGHSVSARTNPASATSPAAAATDDSCAPQNPLAHSIGELFAYPIDDAPTLRAIAQLASLPTKQQAPAFASAVAIPTTTPSAAVTAAVQHACLGDEVAMRTGRLLMRVAHSWTFDIADNPKLTAFAIAAETAIGALAARDELPAATVAAALAPFGLSLASLQGSQAPPSSEEP